MWGWYDLSDVPRDVLGGLVVEYGERARAKIYKERWRADSALLHAVGDAIRAAAKGKQPRQRRDDMPAWLGSAARRWMKDRDSVPGPFAGLRLLELAGLVQFEVDDDYVLQMIRALGSPWNWYLDDISVDPLSWLRRDPALIDHAVWRVFEASGEVSLTNVDQFWSDRAGGGWRNAFLVLVGDGTLPRTRVLDECLATMARDFSSYRVRWFAQLIKALDPSIDELAERQALIRRLLRSDVTATVTQAVRWLAVLDKVGRLDDAMTVPSLVPAVSCPAKSTAIAALRLLDRIRRRSPEVDLVGAARSGLAHPSVDVQQAAAELLQAAGGAWALDADADLLEPSVRRDLGLDSAGGEGVTVAPMPVAAAVPALVPVGADDLLERFAALLEHPSDPIELELVLDRLSQLSDPGVLRPLSKRAAAILKRGLGDWDGNDWLACQLARLVTVAADQPTAVAHPKVPITRFLADRLSEIELTLTGQRRPQPLLAGTNDPAGWVDPGRLVRQLADRGDDHLRGDLLAALLRLAPDGRAEALAEWRADGELGLAVRHALDADGARPDQVQDHHLWVAASRARKPLDDDPVLITAGLDCGDQGRGLDCAIEFRQHIPSRQELRYGDDGSRVFDYELSVAYGPPESRKGWRSRLGRLGRPVQPQAVTVVESRVCRFPDGHDVTGDWHAWTATIWPHDAEHFLATSIDPVFYSTFISGSLHEEAGILDALDRHPGRVGRLVAATVGLALAANALEDRIKAADVLLSLTARGRISPEAIADGMASASVVCVPTRWAESLRSVASGGGGLAVVAILTRLLPTLARDRRGLFALLDVLLQESLRIGRPVSDPTLREFLESFNGSSKASRTARALLRL